MAYASGVQLSGLAGIVGAAIGGYIGYTEAAEISNLTPAAGALILGGMGLVIGSAGAFILKSMMQFLIYVVIFFAFVFVFQNQIEAMTGLNPVNATLNFLADLGLPVEKVSKAITGD